MGVAQIIAGVVSLAITAVAIVLVVARRPADVLGRTPGPARPEPLGPARCPDGEHADARLSATPRCSPGAWSAPPTGSSWSASSLLSSLVLQAYFEVVLAVVRLPVARTAGSSSGSSPSGSSVLGIVAILVLIGDPAGQAPPNRGNRSRFSGSTMWQGYFVEWVVLMRADLRPAHPRLQGRRAATSPFPTWAAPVSHALGSGR